MPVLDRPVTSGWTLAAGGTLALLALAASPPLLGGDVGAALHHAFSAVCHQIPGRSPHLGGGPIALCHRCIGILGGLALGLLLAPLAGSGRLAAVACAAQARWLLAAAVPAGLDWAVGVAGLWTNTPASRFATGAAFGAMAGLILAANLLTSRRPPRHPSTPTLSSHA